MTAISVIVSHKIAPILVVWLPFLLTLNQSLFSVTWVILDVEMVDGRRF